LRSNLVSTETPPGPIRAIPPFINAVRADQDGPSPPRCSLCLHEVEAQFGRTRHTPNAPRTLDLDLLDYDGRRSGRAASAAAPPPARPRLRAGAAAGTWRRIGTPGERNTLGALIRGPAASQNRAPCHKAPSTALRAAVTLSQNQGGIRMLRMPFFTAATLAFVCVRINAFRRAQQRLTSPSARSCSRPMCPAAT
jgi:hypothetical protein